MRNVTYRAKYKKNGKLLFNADMFAGILGVYTGEKPGAFSISENLRKHKKEAVGLIENLAMIVSGYNEISWLIRKTLTECDDYDCATQRLRSSPINSLGYIIVAGTKEGEATVIARDRLGTAHEESLNVT